MNQGHGDPPADVRAFLPRPGEPVQQYAERLRALHRDLTLVLEAVERGLATARRIEGEEVPASEPDAGEEPPRWRRSEAPRAEDEPRAAAPGDVEIRSDVPDELADPWDEGPVEIHPVAAQPPAEASDDVARTRSPRPAVPRIEVRPAPSGERRRDDADTRRPEPVDAPAPAPADARAREEPPRPARFPPRPSAAATSGAAREPEWVEGEHGAAPHAAASAPVASPRHALPAAPAPSPLSPLVVGGLVAGWVTAVALLLALLLG